jgi:hypothetical protein
LNPSTLLFCSQKPVFCSQKPASANYATIEEIAEAQKRLMAIFEKVGCGAGI